jgi:uncharacterized protein (DUF1499 family)
MNDRSTAIVAPLARWSSRIALFSATALVAGVVLHRLTPFPTPVAVNLFLVCLVGIGLAVLLGLIAFAQIWRRGYAGAGSAAVGVLLPLALLAWPLTFVPAFLNLPPINDVTTDVANPPRFAALAKPRADTAANSAAYPGQRVAAEQLKAYPDLRTFVIDRSAQETFELVEDVVRKLKWRVAASDPPAVRPLKVGTIEATDNTLVVGFTDDIVIRVEGSVNRSRIDVRSASRHGQHDLGQNATRVRRFLAELQSRIDTTSAGGVAGRRGLRTTRAGAAVKKLKGRDQKKEELRNERARVRSSAQRERAPKETPR